MYMRMWRSGGGVYVCARVEVRGGGCVCVRMRRSGGKVYVCTFGGQVEGYVCACVEVRWRGVCVRVEVRGGGIRFLPQSFSTIFLDNVSD